MSGWATTFADATKTSGRDHAVQKYIVGQFRSDARLDWVAATRRACVIDELKWKHFKQHQPALLQQNHKALWRAIRAGLSQATIVVIDPTPAREAALRLIGQGDPRDHAFRDALDRAWALQILRETLPVRVAERLATEWFQPSFSSLAFPARQQRRLLAFRADDVLSDLLAGSSATRSLARHSLIFAGRAAASMPIDSDRYVREIETPEWARRGSLEEEFQTKRVFDVELPGSLGVLNRAAAALAEPLRLQTPWIGGARETDSREADAIQAADVAAGVARELLDAGHPLRTLCGRFEKVVHNGTPIQ